MSIIGNKDRNGNSSKYAGVHQVLNGLSAIKDNTGGLLGVLSSILNATVAHQDMEILLVRDDGNDQIVQQIREYDETTSLWTTTYVDVAGATYAFIGNPVYMDASAVLNLMLTEMLAQGVTLDSMLVDTAALVAKDFATETTLLAVLADTNSLDTPIVNSKSIANTPGLGSITAGKRRVSFYNAAKPDVNVDGIVLKRGEVVTFVADGVRDTLDSFSYDALTGELLITTIG
jgi:hypothetical protein